MSISYYLMKGWKTMTLKELRKKRSLTQIALAKELGVSGKTVSLIEVGKLKLSKKLANRIQEVYGEVVEPAAAVAAETVLETEEKVQKRGRKAKAKAQAVEPAVEAAAEAAAETAVEVEEKLVKKARRGRPPKSAAEKKPAKAAKPVKAAKAAKKSAPAIVIQSPLGGEITPDEICAKIGEADMVYVRVDQNKAYWVKGEETGSVDLW